MCARKKRLEYTFGLYLTTDGRRVFGKSGAQVLEAIEKCGSITAAAKELKMSYGFTWNHLARMRKELHQPLIVTRRGGAAAAKKKGGGGAALTPLAKVLLKEFRETERLMQQFLSRKEGPSATSQVSNANRNVSPWYFFLPYQRRLSAGSKNIPFVMNVIVIAYQGLYAKQPSSGGMCMIESEESKVWAKFLSSEIKLELLGLFHTNPRLTTTSEEIAKQISRTRDEIQPDLNDLLEIGVIKKIDNLGSLCLDEDKDGEVQAQIIRYLLKGCDWAPRSYCETFC
jgi:molybdate transport system regulatory protein